MAKQLYKIIKQSSVIDAIESQVSLYLSDRTRMIEAEKNLELVISPLRDLLYYHNSRDSLVNLAKRLPKESKAYQSVIKSIGKLDGLEE